MRIKLGDVLKSKAFTFAVIVAVVVYHWRVKKEWPSIEQTAVEVVLLFARISQVVDSISKVTDKLKPGDPPPPPAMAGA
jgi:hypothetical protein